MTNSVNTNRSALIALQNLNATNRQLDETQSRVNTGKVINSAKDNGALWAVAQNQTNQMNALEPVKQSLQRGQSTIDVHGGGRDGQGPARPDAQPGAGGVGSGHGRGQP